jgi:predicted DNA-binding transcriptional regulator AlpA
MTIASDAQELRDRIGLVSELQFAAMMGVTDYTLQVWRVKGTGPKFVKLGRSIFYRLKHIDEWMDKNVHESTESTGPTYTFQDIPADKLADVLSKMPMTVSADNPRR